MGDPILSTRLLLGLRLFQRHKRLFAAVLAVSVLVGGWGSVTTADEPVSSVTNGATREADPVANSGEDSAKRRPNVLFIAVDDLNDWVGCLGGNPDAKTPNFDEFARQSVLFRNAHCQVALCNASRVSVMTGMYASTTGIYANSLKHAGPVYRSAQQLPLWFGENGYRTMCMGKIYHNDHGKKAYWDEVGPKTLRWGPEPPNGRQFTERFGDRVQDSLAWAALDIEPGEMPDEQIATWAKQQLDKDHEQPFFLALGFYKPHTPMTAPKRYFDLFDRDKLTMPEVLEDDLDDVPEIGRRWVLDRSEIIADEAVDLYSPTYRRELVHAYHACVALTDDCVGQVLSHLKNSRHHDDTIVVLWSDHGWHLGEKGHWRKWMPWEESTRSFLAVRVPGLTADGSVCDRTVGLIDIFPTLAELCDLDAPEQLEGESFRHLLVDPQGEWNRPALTSTKAGNHTVRSDRWRYIRYRDGSEELYDHSKDPNEWTNLASHPELHEVKVQHAQWIDTLTAGEVIK
ncbi:Arylsulfatase A [Neorhodopirellula lusitana]|uniref:Arylsulfatase A n=1 Tax=Neorhodopirellula lusitana TaxID=445327 RepID=A0ABY1Q5M1_9BACT|nr:Arylsulfatase A [Neorhodopirellula lusitana]